MGFLIRPSESATCLSLDGDQAGSTVMCTGDAHQWFYWENDYIKQESLKCVTNGAHPSPQGDQIFLQTCDGLLSQRWSHSSNGPWVSAGKSSESYCVVDRPIIAGTPIASDTRAFPHNVCDWFDSAESQWDFFDLLKFQEEHAPSQISPKTVSGCLNATLEQGVAGLSVGIASCGPGFNQAWYFDGDRIRNMMFYSDKCLAAVSNHFNVEMAPCDDSDAQKWTYKDGVLQNAQPGSHEGKPQCLTLRTNLDNKVTVADCDGPGEMGDQQIIFTPTSYELPRWTESIHATRPQKAFLVYP